jgi:hypothetical protein
MFLLSSRAAALLGLLFASASIENACAWRDTDTEHPVVDPTAVGTSRQFRGLRGLFGDTEGTPESKSLPHPACGAPALTKKQVREFDDVVEQFYQEAARSPAGYRRLQQAITVDVNFVIVQNAAGQGATQEQVNAQIEFLNNAFRPDFVFKLNTMQPVVNDNSFSNTNADDKEQVVERQMKEQYRRGL